MVKTWCSLLFVGSVFFAGLFPVVLPLWWSICFVMLVISAAVEDFQRSTAMIKNRKKK